MCQWFTKLTMIKCNQPAIILLVIRTPFDVYPLELCAGCADEIKADPSNEVLHEVELIPFNGEPVTQSENSTIGNSNGL